MVKGGKGGINTQSGKIFEKNKNILKLFENNKNYKIISKNNKKNYYDLHYKNKLIGQIFKQQGLYDYLKEKKIDWKKYISAKLIPDGAIYVIYKNVLNIIEIKYQKCNGSTDEKLQTCDFKKKQYIKLFSTLNFNIEYIYILNDWFKHDRYKDTLDYIISVGCKYKFDELPLELIGLEK